MEYTRKGHRIIICRSPVMEGWNNQISSLLQNSMDTHAVIQEKLSLASVDVLSTERAVSFSAALLETCLKLKQQQEDLLQFISQKTPTLDELSSPESSKELLIQEFCDSASGSWTASSSGGCMNFPTWRNNPQFFLKVENEGEITVELTQSPGDKENQGIGFYVFYGNQYKEIVSTNGEPLARSPFSRGDTVAATFNISPSADGYVILPCTFHPSLCLHFSLKIQANATGSGIRPLIDADRDTKTTFQGEWKGKSAGGCKNFSSWVYNPQFHLNIAKPTTITALITQTDKEDFDAIGMYVFKAEDSSRPSKVVPEELITKSTFGSDRECTLTFRVDSSCIVIPCTFHAEKEAPFTIQFYTPNNENIAIKEVSDTAETMIEGEWNEATAGGSTSYSTWRNNPQFIIRSDTRCDITLRLVQEKKDSITEENEFHPVGMYAFKDTGKRRLFVTPEDVSFSTPCTNTESIHMVIAGSLLQEISPGKFSTVIMPCTFYANLYGTFRLFASVPDNISPPIIDSYDPFFSHSLSDEWKGHTAGGCLNNGKTWRHNPQFQFTSLEDSRIMILLHLPHKSSGGGEKQSIGFYITEAPNGEDSEEGGRKMFSLVGEDGPNPILKKAPFRKSFEAYVPFKVRKGKRYNIMPCTFLAGVESSFTVSMYTNKANLLSLSPIDPYVTIKASGCWDGENAGGSMNNDSWWMNPRFAIRVTHDVHVTMMLTQGDDEVKIRNEMDVKAIGFHVCNADENLDPLLAHAGDLIGSASYEQALDVATSISISKSERPYLFIPSTFYPATKAPFQIFLFIREEDRSFIDFIAFPTDENVPSVVEVLGEVVEEIEEVEEVAELVVMPVVEPVVTPAVEPVVEKIPIEEPTQVINQLENASTEGSEVLLPPPAPTEDGTPPPPPPTVHSKLAFKPIKATVPKKVVKAQEDPDDLFAKIRSGKFLRKVTETEKTNYKTRFQSEMFKGFDMEKIINRRAAMEFSDEEDGEDWSDHEDEEEWW